MKKVVKLIAILGSIVSLIGCKGSNEVTLNIISMNDTHGALIETHASAGLIKGATYIESVRKENRKGTIILSAGFWSYCVFVVLQFLLPSDANTLHYSPSSLSVRIKANTKIQKFYYIL